MRPSSDSVPLFGVGGGDGEVGVGAQNECYVAVPGVVAAHLIMIQADLGLRGLEAFLDRPSGPGDPDQVLVLGVGGSEAQVVGQVRGVLDAASDQQPVAVAVPGREATAQS